MVTGVRSACYQRHGSRAAAEAAYADALNIDGLVSLLS
jgi:hypothetical protein